MKVEIISGNEKGLVKDLPQVEAEVAVQTGFAKLAEQPLPSAADLDAVAEEQGIADATSAPKKSRKSRAAAQQAPEQA